MTSTAYQPGTYHFNPDEYLPKRLFDAITGVRVDNPDVIFAEAARRQRRQRIATDGRLVILATDHPARRVTTLPGDPMGMAGRRGYLARSLRILATPGCDGIMGATDFMEDLLILNALLREAGGPSLIDGKVLIGCMNRGGHAGVAGEIDDTFTSYDAPQLKRMNFEGGKLMYRLDMEDERSIKSITDCANAVSALHRESLYAFLEPMSVKRTAEGYQTVKTVEALARDAGAAAALGVSSARTWLKLSYVEGYEQVAGATTLPILMLGGPAKDTPIPTLRDFHAGMNAAANVRGVMVGRNVTYGADDPRAIAAAVCGVIHDGCTVDQAVERLHAERGRELDLFSAWR